MKKKINIPKFKDEDAERDYWSKINLSDYFEVADFKPVAFSKLESSS